MTRRDADQCDRCTAAAADLARIRAELIDRLNRCDDFEKEAALGWIAYEQPDLVNDAITETGGPSL